MKTVNDSHIMVYRGLGEGGEGISLEPRGSIGSFLQRFSMGSHRTSPNLLSSPTGAIDRQSLLSVEADEDAGSKNSDSEDDYTRC